MAKETKHERIARGMIEQLTEHMHDLKNHETSGTSKERDIENWCQGMIKSCLGFSASAGYTIRSQETKGKMRPDLIVMKGDKPVFVVEVKKLGFDLGKSDFRSGKVQLKEYLHALGDVRWGVLCNGVEWKLYDFSVGTSGGIEIASIDMKSGADHVEITKKSCEDLTWELLELHETTFASNAWDELSREAMAFSPESLAKAILSADIVKSIAKSIRGEHEYKANFEILTDKLYWLLEQGLNDAIPGWNESRVAEMQKYLKSQKRASRRTKRTAKGVTTEIDSSAPEIAQVPSPATETQPIMVASAPGNSEKKNVA